MGIICTTDPQTESGNTGNRCDQVFICVCDCDVWADQTYLLSKFRLVFKFSKVGGYGRNNFRQSVCTVVVSIKLPLPALNLLTFAASRLEEAQYKALLVNVE